MTIAELGARLREAREGRNWTVADVSDVLKIPARILTGIEEGSERLPHTVYVFHFIKDYARYLGFSPEEAASMANSLEGFEKAAQPVRDASVQYTPVRPSPMPKIFGAALKLALFAALGFGGYNAYLHFFAERNAELISAQTSAQQNMPAGHSPAWNAPQQGNPATEQAQSAEPQKTAEVSAPSEDAAQLAASATETGGAASGKESVQAEKISMPPQPAPNWDAPAAVPPQSTFVTAAAAQDPATPHPAYLLGQDRPAPVDGAALTAQENGMPELPPVPEGMHQVLVSADQGDCWMSFEPDGKKQQRMLRKGDSFTMTFSDALQLRLGNAAAVRIIYDGKELDRSSAARPVNMTFPLAQP
ncbi:MAG: DUF4115 domain-containing protein [Mailhella sp.]|nr:DUF4115 domain-containing protein [Mailhella sp.]